MLVCSSAVFVVVGCYVVLFMCFAGFLCFFLKLVLYLFCGSFMLFNLRIVEVVV